MRTVQAVSPTGMFLRYPRREGVARERVSVRGPGADSACLKHPVNVHVWNWPSTVTTGRSAKTECAKISRTGASVRSHRRVRDGRFGTSS